MDTVVGSLIYIKARRVTELFPPSFRKLFRSWELHAMVLVSLTLQIILIVFGDCRKRSNRVWTRIVLWTAYLMADWVATVALGVILDNLVEAVEGIGQGGRLDPDVELTAFWAPFLLLHLGGPDTVTAYSLEDNELWLRHLLGLGVETGVALYITILAWTGSRLSFLSLLMLCAGIIKYGERTWSLREASNEVFRASMVTQPDPGPNYAKFMQEYGLKQYEGFEVKKEEITDGQVAASRTSDQDQNNPYQDELEQLIAYDLLQAFKRLFVDLVLGVDDRERSRSSFLAIETDKDKAYRLIEMELGFAYDMLYTKAPLIHSKRGWILRSISVSCSCAVLVFFSLADHKKCSNSDLIITYLLSGAAILLEVLAVLLLISSDWTVLWLGQHLDEQKPNSCLKLPKPSRWSKSMLQFDALSFYLKDKHIFCGEMLKHLCFYKVLEKHYYTKHRDVCSDLKELIFDHLKTKAKRAPDVATTTTHIRDIISCRGSQVLEEYHHTDVKWSVEVNFDQSILIWHIATYLCYSEDHPRTTEDSETSNEKKYRKLSKRLSQYMLYLLLMRPSMLPVGIGMIRFQDTEAEFVKLFEGSEFSSSVAKSQRNIFSWVMRCYPNATRNSKADKRSEACKRLRKVNTEIDPVKVKGDRSRSVLFEGCRLASQLQQGPLKCNKEKWEMISNVWVEMLAYAASQCRGNYHAQQLRRGGELLTHVWLLMAHFGLTEQFQVSKGHAGVEFV
ncbi:uncharacterized protein LOC107434632 [Ziziphus jujuba]|uniref:Uncharacterized protein LOC107434632 n=1 Tax=Ziziphus jujuba TaxID=326968 RepID=A0A6P4BFE2_ZIZJJ|nr:uncharacterized protein LOC107434632 [Ziziphus jujuba]